MGRTVPSFRFAHMHEEREWKEFRRSLSKPERKEFDIMFASCRLYISACSYSTRPVRIQPILMSIAFHHYKQLLEISKTLAEPASH